MEAEEGEVMENLHGLQNMKEQRILGVDLSNTPDSSYYMISFRNHGFYTKEHVNSAITKYGKPVGIITEVSDDIVKGAIWNSKFPLSEFQKRIDGLSFETIVE